MFPPPREAWGRARVGGCDFEHGRKCMRSREQYVNILKVKNQGT